MARGARKFDYNDPVPSRLRALIDEETTQGRIAEITGVTRQTVGTWIAGKTVPDSLSIIKIAKAFDVSADWLLGLSNVKTISVRKSAICAETGLSEKAVDRLKETAGDGFTAEFISEMLVAPSKQEQSEGALMRRLETLFNRAKRRNQLDTDHVFTFHPDIKTARMAEEEALDVSKFMFQQEFSFFIDTFFNPIYGGMFERIVFAAERYVSEIKHHEWCADSEDEEEKLSRAADKINCDLQTIKNEKEGMNRNGRNR